MAQVVVLAIFILGIMDQFSLTQSVGFSSSTISPYKDMHLTSGLTSTSFTTKKTIMLLHQILLQETSLRMDLEKTVRDLMKEFEQMKRNQAEVKKEQEILNQELIDNITSLRTENQQLKDELEQIVNSGMGTCKCDLTNITSDFHNFKSDFSYNVSLSLLDFQKEINSTTANILHSSDDKIGAVSRDISDMQSAFKNLSGFIDRDRNFQASVNDDILVQQQNISNVIIETLPLDCKELYMNGKRKSGVYTIYPWERSDPNYRPVQVYCDMETEGGGWTVRICT
uniref:Fibrinogen C-terminal domain-containing protein n=2 Tax=Magallana gigas TaxID=29159 RepID=A0A8W8JLM9_MAGGI